LCWQSFTSSSNNISCVLGSLMWGICLCQDMF
jgi:hypothetical protein